MFVRIALWGNCPKVRVSKKASYIGIPTYDYTVVATGTYRSDQMSHPDPDSAYSESGFSESGSDILRYVRTVPLSMNL